MDLADRKALEFAAKAERLAANRRKALEVGASVVADRVLSHAARVQALRCSEGVRQEALDRVWAAFEAVSVRDDGVGLSSPEVSLGGSQDVLLAVHGSDAVYSG